MNWLMRVACVRRLLMGCVDRLLRIACVGVLLRSACIVLAGTFEIILGFIIPVWRWLRSMNVLQRGERSLQ